MYQHHYQVARVDRLIYRTSIPQTSLTMKLWIFIVFGIIFHVTLSPSIILFCYCFQPIEHNTCRYNRYQYINRKDNNKNKNDNNHVVIRLVRDKIDQKVSYNDDRKGSNMVSSSSSSSSMLSLSKSDNVDGTSFANLVIQMEKKEQAAMKASGSKGLLIEDQVLELDPIPGQHSSSSISISSDISKERNNGYIEANKGKWNEITASNRDVKSSSTTTTTPLRVMDIETAKDLDEAVSFPVGTRQDLVDNFIMVPLNDLYTATLLTIIPAEEEEERTKKSSYTSSESALFTNVTRKKSFLRKIAFKLRLLQEKDNIEKKSRLKEQQQSIIRSSTSTSSRTISSSVPSSRPDQYIDRISRDRRQLAVSIAASIDTVDQWMIFCREHGGVYPILEAIREGAKAIRVQQDKINVLAGTGSQTSITTSSSSSSFSRGSDTTDWVSSSPNFGILYHKDYQEETFHAASTACRTIRDLCAISPELAAVITDSILRANASWKGGIMEDLRTILEYASDYTAETTKVGQTRFGKHKLRNPFDAIDASRAIIKRRYRRESRVRCKLYVTQLLLAMTVAGDDAVTAIRDTDGLKDMIIRCSSFALKEQTRRWLRYPGELIKWIWKLKARTSKARDGTIHEQESETISTTETLRRPFMEAANLASDLNGSVQRSANQLLAAIGHNQWTPKTPGQRGLRVLSLDGGGSRGISAISTVSYIMDKVGKGADVADLFDMIVGTSTGAIISFLVGLKRESSARALTRYQQLISKIFIKSALSTPLMLFTTATYDESHFMDILSKILEEKNMLDTRADPSVPLVCCLTSKMSSTPTHVALFRNYNYGEGELADPFVINPDQAREDLGLPLDIEHEVIRNGRYNRKLASKGSPGVRMTSGSRHPGSFRVLQRYALRASTAAPTVFKPVMMGGEMYCDGGIVTSNPTAVAIHEARAVFPNVPIELVVSVGTGNFLEEKSAPRIGWDGIIGQIVNSATDAEQVHHILEDVFGPPSLLSGNSDKSSAVSSLQYCRFNPVVGRPDEFPIDVTDPEKLMRLRQITEDYLKEPEQQDKIERIDAIFNGRKSWMKRVLLNN